MPEIDIFIKTIRQNLDISGNFRHYLVKFRTPSNLDKFSKKLDKFRTHWFTDDSDSESDSVAVSDSDSDPDSDPDSVTRTLTLSQILTLTLIPILTLSLTV